MSWEIGRLGCGESLRLAIGVDILHLRTLKVYVQHITPSPKTVPVSLEMFISKV